MAAIPKNLIYKVTSNFYVLFRHNLTYLGPAPTKDDLDEFGQI